MKYYIMNTDNRINNSISFNEFGIAQTKDFDDFVISEDFSKNIKLTDYFRKKFLFETRHIVSDLVKEVMVSYDEELKNRAIIVTDFKASKQYTYWEIMPELNDCIVNEKLMNLQNLKLYKHKQNDKYLFKVQFEKQDYIVVRFDLAESIMRRFPLGIKFVPLQINKEAENDLED